ncbi:MAG: hypothetical protein ACRDAM_15795 [Casimicrobium sp.]
MRYSFRTIAGMPSVPSVGLSVVLADKVSSQGGKAATIVPLVDLAVATTTPNVAAGIGTPANVTFNFTNPGAIAGDGATITLPWLANNANRTVGAATVTPSGGAVTATPSNAALLAGLAVSAFPVGAEILVTVPVTALVAFSESMIAQVAPPEGVGDVVPTNNVAVATVVGAAPMSGAVWLDFDVSTNTAISIGASVSDQGGANIAFCGDGFTRAKDFSGYSASPCPIDLFTAQNGARWQIKLLDYSPTAVYAVEHNTTALTPQPSSSGSVFDYSQVADVVFVDTDYALLGDVAGDGVACAGNVTFTVKKDGSPIATLTLVLTDVSP